MKILKGLVFFIDLQIKSARNGYRDQGIGIMSILHKSSELRPAQYFLCDEL